ncbi:MAG: DUF6316 family protein [Gammaproteobacteria bacterium]|nr:DUF6316 family protein [Gammaproteobacteria bacterium]MCW8987340.1 DUF6316 family protein [Gammaproteobacteria bacterium]MCW9030543.1 DUF6316 family protein [Gammaproteobacteria bacterium]
MNLTDNKTEQNIISQQSQIDKMTSQYQNNAVSPRKGEDAKQTRFRANRLFSSGTAWYFSTRDGKERGPFMSKENAQKAIEDYLKEVSF